MDVRFQGVVVRRGGRDVLHVPDLTIRGGRVTAVLGPNGAGKSTLLRTIAGLDRPALGEVTLAGSGVPSERAAFAFQRAVFVSGTVEQNLQLGLQLRGVPAAQRRGRIDAVVGRLGVSHLLRRQARSLSGGEQQRVNLARALVLHAPLVLLDEPLAGADAHSREELLRQLSRVLRADSRTTVVLVTHDRDDAARLADDVVLLLEGRVHASGAIRDVFSRPPDVSAALFLGWAVFERDGATVAIAPGALQAGTGEIELSMEVETVVPSGRRWEAAGHIEGARARVTGEGEWPQPGPLLVSVRRSELLVFDLREERQNPAHTITNH